jgi:hypothetical protein
MPPRPPSSRPESTFVPFIPDKLPSGRPVPEAWKQALFLNGAYGQPPQMQTDIREDGIGIDLLDATERIYPLQHTDINAVKACRMALIHDSGMTADIPRATREYLHSHGKAGIACERLACPKIQLIGEKASLKRCGRVRRLHELPVLMRPTLNFNSAFKYVTAQQT